MKIHIFHSEIPISSGVTINAACGQKVANATPVYMIDYAIYDSAFAYSPTTCHKCRKVNTQKRYMYAIAQGEEIEQERGLHV